MPKMSGLTVDTAPTKDDRVPTVNDPAGTPATKLVALEDIFEALNDVDRGDPAADDWTHATLTADGNWHDLDCSSVVPAGARFIHLHVVIQDDAVDKSIAFRKNGNAQLYNVRTLSTQVVNLYNYTDFKVPCDTSRVIEYQLSNTTWTFVSIVITGWSY